MSTVIIWNTYFANSANACKCRLLFKKKNIHTELMTITTLNRGNTAHLYCNIRRRSLPGRSAAIFRTLWNHSGRSCTCDLQSLQLNLFFAKASDLGSLDLKVQEMPGFLILRQPWDAAPQLRIALEIGVLQVRGLENRRRHLT